MTQLCHPDDTAPQSPGLFWQCPCGAYNPIGRYVCSGCAKQFSIQAGSSTVEQAPYKRTVAGSNPERPSTLSDSRPARRVLSLTSAHFSHGTAVIAGRGPCSGTALNPTSRQCQYCGRGSSCDCDRFRDVRV